MKYQPHLQILRTRQNPFPLRLSNISNNRVRVIVSYLDALSSKPALYISLIKHSNALSSLQREHKKHLEREKALGDILDALRSGYNPNYQDMAVLEAVRGWEQLAGLPASNVRDQEKENEKEPETDPAIVVHDSTTETPAEVEELEEGAWTAEQLENDLDGLLDSDYVSLLLEHDEHVNTAPPGSLCERCFLLP